MTSIQARYWTKYIFSNQIAQDDYILIENQEMFPFTQQVDSSISMIEGKRIRFNGKTFRIGYSWNYDMIESDTPLALINPSYFQISLSIEINGDFWRGSLKLDESGEPDELYAVDADDDIELIIINDGKIVKEITKNASGSGASYTYKYE